MKRFKVYPQSVKASCGTNKKYVKGEDAVYNVNELEDVVTDILEGYKFDIGGPLDNETFEHMVNNITFNIDDWGDDELIEIAQYYEGTEELRDLFLQKCRELEIGFVR